MKEWHKSRTFTEALGCAWQGILDMYRQEANVRRQLLMFLGVLILGIVLGIKPAEFALLFIASGLVLGLEFINSAIEEIEDLMWPEYEEAVRRSKDISAGAVLVASLAALGTGCIIFIPYLAKLFLLVY